MSSCDNTLTAAGIVLVCEYTLQAEAAERELLFFCLHRQLQAEAAERKSKFVSLQKGFKANEDKLREQVVAAQVGSTALECRRAHLTTHVT